MTPHENFIIGALSAAWFDLTAQDRERGGDGLRDIAITLTKGRTIITVHSDYHDDARTLSTWFILSRPLPPSMCELLSQFLIDLHDWFEGGQAAPNLPMPQPRITLH